MSGKSGARGDECADAQTKLASSSQQTNLFRSCSKEAEERHEDKGSQERKVPAEHEAPEQPEKEARPGDPCKSGKDLGQQLMQTLLGSEHTVRDTKYI